MGIYCNSIAENINPCGELSILARRCIGMAYYHSFHITSKQIQAARYENIHFNHQLVEQIVTIKNQVIACCFAEKMLQDQNLGFRDFYEMLITPYPKGVMPDYSRWQVTRDKILDMSKNMHDIFASYTKDIQTERKGK